MTFFKRRATKEEMMDIWGILGQVIWVSLFVHRGALEPLRFEVDIRDLPDIPDTSDDEGLQPRSSAQTRLTWVRKLSE